MMFGGVSMAEFEGSLSVPPLQRTEAVFAFVRHWELGKVELLGMRVNEESGKRWR
jgi:hypothetical protein